MRDPSRRQYEGIASVVLGILRATSIGIPAALVDAPRATAGAPESAALSAGIPAEPLAQALESFARQTGLQLVYVSEIVHERKSHAVPAGLAAPDALARMLEGTGLKFDYLTPRSIHILEAAVVPTPVAVDIVPDDKLEELIVSANRRDESLQDVPMTIQALSGEQLSELNVNTFYDVMKYTANVTYSGNGPATGNIFIRGLGSPGTGNQSQSTIAPFPNVALYLDEQAMQFPTRNNDLYVIDLNRIEVLEGPQGTLFGGGAQAGVIRYITNKPRLDAVKYDISAGFGTTAGGAPNYLANATINLPLVAGKFALRAVGFVDYRGGYIDNVAGTISFSSPPMMSPVADNASLVGKNTNSVEYSGFRLSGLYKFTDDWDLLIQQSYQRIHADGYFYAYPIDSNGNTLGPNQITAFTPAYNKDTYDSTAWTLDGKFGDLKAIYAGSYMNRVIDAQQDYSNYLSSGAGTYYDCIGPGAAYFNDQNFSALAGKPLRCYAPLGTWHDNVQNNHQSHEIRLSTPEDSRVRGLVGAYWEKFVVDDAMDFNFLGIPQCSAANLANVLAGGADCLSALGPFPGAYASHPGLREGMNNAFGEDVQRGYRQTAFFASIDFDIVPTKLTLSAGTRHYHYDEFEEGSVWQSATTSSLIVNHLNGSCTSARSCGFPINLSKSESGFRSRANLTWHINPEVMTYYTYSQGFRPGGFNRTLSYPGQAPPPVGVAHYCGNGPNQVDPRCNPPDGSLYLLNQDTAHGATSQQIKPYSYTSDNLTNNEIGIKSEFLHHRLRVNASAYLMHWNNVQSMAQGLSSAVLNFTNIVNGPSYNIRGLEMQVTAGVTGGLTLEGTGSWNSSEQSNVPCLRSSGVTPTTPHNPTPAGQCITVVAGQRFELGVLSSSVPFAPPVIFNLRARYDWHGGNYHPFAWVAVSHTAAFSNEPKNFPDGSATEPVTSTVLRYEVPGYTTYDAALGASRDHWKAQLTGSNLSNANAATNISSAQFIKATVPLRPRVLTMLLTYTF
jgi:iron complex outermembrane recepter protein